MQKCTLHTSISVQPNSHEHRFIFSPLKNYLIFAFEHDLTQHQRKGDLTSHTSVTESFLRSCCMLLQVSRIISGCGEYAENVITPYVPTLRQTVPNHQ